MTAPAHDKKPDIRRRVVLVAVLLAAGYIGVFARLGYLQVIRHGELSARAARQQQEVVDLPPKRGTIYDRRGSELAVSIDAQSLYGVPADVDNPRAAARKLAPALGMSAQVLEDKLTGNRKFVWLARKVAPDVPARVNASCKDMKEAFGWLTDCRRYYPKKDIASQVLGFTGTDNRGLEGLEAQYENYIGGVAGKAITERDGAGHEVLSVDEAKNSPKPGCDVTLTLDENVQYIAEKELDDVVAKYSPVSATAIVMDPRTGEILAMANRPGFNPNSPGSFNPSAYKNRAVTDLYEPGSTFKVVTAAAALEEGVVKPSDIIDCGNGEIEVAGRIIHNAHKEGGRLSFAEVIQKSSNVGTVKVALKLGSSRLYKYARAFGFGARTGVDLPGESGGRLRELRDWSGMSLASVAIGQETSVTALQMLTAVNTIANGGYYVEPYVVSEIRSDSGTVVRRAQPQNKRRVISQATARKLSGILTSVVEDGGTAVEARIRGWQVAGKTGTAQKFDRAIGRYSKQKYTGSFVGFVPAEDPKISAIVVVNEPHGAYYGGVVAAPAFKNIVEKTLTYMKVPTRIPEQTILVER
jgi:cell division protein FtsI (penicillin-binding protein 3)